MEEKASFWQSAFDFIRSNILVVVIVGVGIALLGIGSLQYFLTKESSSELEFIKARGTDGQVAGEATSTIVVDVSGQVVSPGLYTIPSGSRINDAIQAAGGFSSGADQEYISKKINLAQKAIDGGKIYIPAVGETPPANAVVSSSTVTTDASSTDPSVSGGLIDINSATESQLDTLPRVGPVTIKKIIDGRPYGSIEELVSKKVMGQATFNGLRDLITAQ